MKVRNKGFTITELVIVIAVIAILAAVLIPTFSNVIEKANQTAASSSCNVALSEYIAMVTLDGDPDNNDVTGVVFSSNNYYYVYDGEKLNYIGNSEKDNAKLLAVTSFDTDITSLTGFKKQSVEEGTAVYEGKMKFTIGEQSVEVDLSDTTRTLYLYNVDIDGTTYAGFFTINNTYGGSGNVIQTVNYSYQGAIADSTVTVGQVEVSEEVELVLESISAQYLSNVPIYTGDNKTITPEEVKVTATYQGNIKQLLSANLYTLDGAEIDTTSVGERIVTVIYSEDTSITTQFSVNVTEKQTRTYYFFNSNNWQTPHAYVWREEYISVKPAVGDFVLMGNILSTENAWSVDSSIKMFYDSNSNEYVVKGLRIEADQQFKIAKILESGVQYYNLNEANSDYKYSFDPTNDSNLYNTNNGDQNITINAGGLYDIYFKSGNVLYIEKSKDQTAENEPNVAIISTYSDGGWPGKEMTKEGNLGLWTVEVDARATYVVFNDGVSEDKVIGETQTADIKLDSNAENIYYYDGGWHSDYTMYYFYNAYNWNKVYANATTTEPIALMSTSTSTDIGIRMTAVEGKPGWFAVPVASGCETIVFNNGDVNGTVDNNDCVEVEINTQNKTDVYYNPNNATAEGGGWSSSIKTTIYYFYNAAGWEKVYAHYWVEDGPGTTWHGVEMTPVDGQDGWFSIDIDDNFEKVVFNDGLGDVEGVNKTANLILSPATPYCTFENCYSEMPTMVTYYFYNARGWESVYADFGIDGGNATAWPGILMIDNGDGWWSIEIANNIVNNTNNFVIFNDGQVDPEVGVGQTNKLKLGSYQYCTFDNWKESKDCLTTYYFYNVNNWTNVYAYAWTDPTVERETVTKYFGKFPGTEMKDIGDGWWSIAVDSSAVNIIFSDGSNNDANKTGNLTLNSETPYYNDGWMATMHTHTYSGDCDTTCNECGATRETTAEHTYDNGCDTDCNVCGKVRETTHNYETKYDETYHWKECSVCKQTTEKVEHVWNEGVVTKDPTCTEAGEKTFTCECGATKIEGIPMLPHNPDLEWTSDGTSHWHTCGTCQQQLDKAEHVFDQKIETEDYLATAATCTNAATYYYSCECGAVGLETFEIGDALGHLAGEKWLADETNHWKLCTRCGEHLEESAHTGGTATCTEQATCEICNNAYGALEEHNFVNNVCQHCHSVKYYFYNFGKWSDVYAYAWTEEFVGDQPAIGEKVLICKTPDGIEYSFKLTPSDNEYVIQGLYLPEGTSVKVGKLEDSGNYFYYTLKEINEGTSTGKGTTELKLITTGMHDFYFSENYNNDKLWINKVEGNSSELPYFKKVIEFKAWPGTAMQDMGDGWWYVSIDAKAENIIFNGAIGETRYQTDNLTLNPVTPYYCINGWKDTPDISDIIVLDLTEANNWITTSPRFAVYLFNGASSDADNNGMWLDMTAIAGNSVNYYYAVDISGLDYSKFTVCRMNPESTENNWDNKWNQTTDLQISNGLYVKIPADYWNGEIGGNQSTIGV
ncbi:MAG TPA: starch-binding protein [Candidatus Limihabitans stercoravium]|nr:starch-binding protein [Candidatus Limihabitans stercoravium]